MILLPALSAGTSTYFSCSSFKCEFHECMKYMEISEGKVKKNVMGVWGGGGGGSMPPDTLRCLHQQSPFFYLLRLTSLIMMIFSVIMMIFCSNGITTVCSSVEAWLVWLPYNAKFPRSAILTSV